MHLVIKAVINLVKIGTQLDTAKAVGLGASDTSRGHPAWGHPGGDILGTSWGQ